MRPKSYGERKRMKKAIALMALLLVCFAVFAQIKNPSRLTISPAVSIQEIRYDRHYVDKSTVGPGLSFDYYYFFDETKALGGELSIGYFNYNNFHSYIDARLEAEFQFRALKFKLSGEKFISVNLAAGVGVGLAYREDADWGVYGIYKGGIGVEFNSGWGLGVNLGFDASLTFQRESFVAQYMFLLGIVIPLGGRT